MAVFKLDENLSPALKEPLVAAGHDVATVVEEGLQDGSRSGCGRAGRLWFERLEQMPCAATAR